MKFLYLFFILYNILKGSFSVYHHNSFVQKSQEDLIKGFIDDNILNKQKSSQSRIVENVVQKAKDFLNGNSQIPKQVLHKNYLLKDQENREGSEYYQDICGEATEGNILQLNCTCHQGIINDITFAAYGKVGGTCPHYYYDTTCVKEVFDIVQRNGKCVGKESCIFKVDSNDYFMETWTNPDPITRKCIFFKPHKLKIVAQCKCQSKSKENTSLGPIPEATPLPVQQDSNKQPLSLAKQKKLERQARLIKE